MVACRQDDIFQHLSDQHLEESFRVEEQDVPPPSGNFTCVARCTLDGEWIGPPNHNTYQEKLREIHQSKYSDMPFADYEQHVEMVRDPEAIEAWKASCTRKRVFYPKAGKDTENALTFNAARALFRTTLAPNLIRKTRTPVLPSRIARRTEDAALMHLLTRAWQRENRYPSSLLFALRGAFKHQHLFIFKTGRDMIFVGSTKPSPLDPDHVVDSIREVLLYLQEHPGCTRAELMKHLRPEATEDSPEARDVLTSLSWLIEKGHIIEFFNGTLAVPVA